MRLREKLPVSVFIFLLVMIIIISCSKGGGGDGGNRNPCEGVTISVSGTASNASSPTASDGSISASAAGGSGFTFQLNSGTFQASGNFTNLAAGTYTVTAKDNRGCTASKQFTVNANPADPCSSVTFTVSATSTSSSPCNPYDGTVTVTVSGGGSGFTYNINGGTFSASPTFTDLGPGNYTVGAKEAGGCFKTTNITITSKTAGTLFTAVKTMMQANCAITGCHNGTQAPNWTVDCNIVANSALIKQRAVDGTPSFMPPTGQLSQVDKDKITNWINAGGRYTD